MGALKVLDRTFILLVPLVNLLLFGLLQFQITTVPDPKITGIAAWPLALGIANTILILLTQALCTRYKLGDPYITSIVAMLMTIGLGMQYRLSPQTGIKQFIWFLVGTAIFLGVTAIFPKLHQRLRGTWLFYGGMVGLFLITLLFGVRINAAKNWLNIGGFTFQPSEFIKILFVFFLAAFMSRAKPPNPTKSLIVNLMGSSSIHLAGLVFFLLGLFAIQKEYGTALLIFMVYLSLLYVFERRIWFVLANIGLASGLGLVAIRFVNHLQVRIDTWLNPLAYIDGKGYQITQSLFAIGSGSFFGSGLTQGFPSFIPNVSTDFVFAAICEEMGIFGGIAVILLFFMLVYRAVKISLRLRSPFNKALAFGLAITIGYQTFIIIGGVIKLIPLTGITLPFVSYGGSSLIASYMMVGLLQALSGQILKEEVMAGES